MIERIAWLIGTWFGCGKSPVAPGTAGSLGALVVAVFVEHHHHWEPSHFAGAAAVLLLPGIWAAGRLIPVAGSKDPGLVVVDEVIGQWITLAGVVRWNWKAWVLAFCLFRLFDIVKPFPVRQLERLPGGVGIVIDDVGAGIYAALVLWTLGWFNLY